MTSPAYLRALSLALRAFAAVGTEREELFREAWDVLAFAAMD